MTLYSPSAVAIGAAEKPQPTGVLFDIRKYSIHDGPGIRTAVFFKGCPLRCLWCHNPESQSFEPELILRPGRCIGCGACEQACPHGAIEVHPQSKTIFTDRARCQACGECTRVCYAEGRQLIGQEYSLEQVWLEIESDLVFYRQSGGGVTFTGGEPMSQRPFLLALLRLCKARGLHTALDTSGYCSWSALDEVRPLVDLFLYDLN
jgi:pyruvate formate lyase activating enzyme